MTPYERLMAEELPTGRFGDAPRTEPRRRTKPADASHFTVASPTSPERAAANLRALEAGMAGWRYTEPDPEDVHHLRSVPNQTAA
ncbi:hypothetical protein Srufu_080310 (plasmid) [Streptomyces libani subsp. rufus]|nr:hypothetical protein Srufu_080310 [Streptomyces libani subsp. rufus]